MTFIFFLGFAIEILIIKASIKYETISPNDCISKITGKNLCSTLLMAKWITVFFGLLFILLIIFKNRNKKTDTKNH